MKPLPLNKLINVNYLTKAIVAMNDTVGDCIDDIDENGMLPVEVYKSYQTILNFLNDTHNKVLSENA